MTTSIHGLVKFFGNKKYLDDFMDGLIYCNTPEYYRTTNKAGTGDLFESCIYSYRANREQAQPRLVIDGEELKDWIGLTMWRPSDHDSWMHCWFIIEQIHSKQEFESLAADLQRTADELGSDFAFLPAANMRAFGKRIAEHSRHEPRFIPIKYSDNRFEWSIRCKSNSYKYQRELRYVFGLCDSSCTDPYGFKISKGFKDLIYQNCTIRLTSPDIASKLYISPGNVSVF